MNTIKKILIANRGEIAVRIIHSIREMGITTVAIYSDQDRNALHKEIAHESFFIGKGSLSETYLNVNKIIQTAIKSNADAIHPGYGFLAENPEFATACKDNKIRFIGPDALAIKTMGNKLEAARFVEKLGIPLMDIKTGTLQELLSQTKTRDFPVMIKAAAGGGGKGMRIVRDPSQLKEALESTSREAKNYFGNEDVYIEKYIENPKHIEIQILGDKHGNYIHLNERECSVQRRHQKIIEEAPSPFISQEIRNKMGEAALKIAKGINYTSAGTVEFLVDENKNFHFLEMNTRIQVEHPVTELITGVDIVKEQIRIANDLPISKRQEDIRINGHAIEARIYAENPMKNFLPSPGKIYEYKTTEADNLRLDNGIRSGDIISPDFDPLISKAIVWNENRDMAIESLRNNLSQFVITGIEHNINYLSELLDSQEFRKNTITTNYIDQHNQKLIDQLMNKKNTLDIRFAIAVYIFAHSFSKDANIEEQAWKHIGYWRPFMQWSIQVNGETKSVEFTRHSDNVNITMEDKSFTAEVIKNQSNEITIKLDGKQLTIPFAIKQKQTEIVLNGYSFNMLHNDYKSIVENKENVKDKGKNSEKIISPMFGKVVNIKVAKDMKVNEGQTLMILEAMKMENNILAVHDGIIKNIAVKEGEQVEDGQILIETYDN